jgi:hypothetical protein
VAQNTCTQFLLANSLAVRDAYEVQVIVPLLLDVSGGELGGAQCLLHRAGWCMFLMCVYVCVCEKVCVCVCVSVLEQEI